MNLAAHSVTELRPGFRTRSRRLLTLTDRLVDGVREKGYRVVSSRRLDEGSGIVAFRCDEHDLDQIQRHLQDEHRIVISVRSARLRAIPHFHKSEREIDQLIDALPKR